MAPAKENKVMHWVQTVLLSLITAGILWVGNSLVELKVQFASISTKQEQDRQTVSELRTTVAEFRLKMNWTEDKANNHEKRISVVEALLPERLRKKKEE
jgi:hypothetical protein